MELQVEFAFPDRHLSTSALMNLLTGLTEEIIWSLITCLCNTFHITQTVKPTQHFASSAAASVTVAAQDYGSIGEVLVLVVFFRMIKLPGSHA